jgi:regulator of nucleoside diphosphate kinase
MNGSVAASASLPPIWLTQRDMQRLREVVQKYASSGLSEAAEALELELDRAQLVGNEQLPADVVTMRSRFLCRQVETGKTHEFVLVYPHEADAHEGKISVLAPVGIASLGLRVGSKIRWPLPSGRSTELELLEVLHQPEAAGELDP